MIPYDRGADRLPNRAYWWHGTGSADRALRRYACSGTEHDFRPSAAVYQQAIFFHEYDVYRIDLTVRQVNLGQG
jgi:hypothetical protein